MWKANGKTTTLVLFLDNLFPKREINARIWSIAFMVLKLGHFG
jgi:hypothetical protein